MQKIKDENVKKWHGEKTEYVRNENKGLIVTT